MVFPKPEELKSREDKRFKEMGKEVPADALNNMLGIPFHLHLSSNILMDLNCNYFSMLSHN